MTKLLLILILLFPAIGNCAVPARELDCNVVRFTFNEEKGVARWQNGQIHNLLPIRNTGAEENWVVADSYEDIVNVRQMSYLILAEGIAVLFDTDGGQIWVNESCRWL
ncbi:MAG: hypothetical protein QF530_10630 [SAR202 cluster bacterium]|jgi:hypothetical protein|nr:hypothetical protein [SAR202 cluster bacterium]|tara:strand:+ start:720 stop:1043 length:324 start_codon:yes stop_codon:yes gene_type:complete